MLRADSGDGQASTHPQSFYSGASGMPGGGGRQNPNHHFKGLKPSIRLGQMFTNLDVI